MDRINFYWRRDRVMMMHDEWKWARRALLLGALVAVPACGGAGNATDDIKQGACAEDDCEPPDEEEPVETVDSPGGCIPPGCGDPKVSSGEQGQ